VYVRRRAVGRDLASVDRPLFAVREPHQHGGAAAEPGQVRVDNVEGELDRGRGVDRVPTGAQHVFADLRRDPVVGRDDPAGGVLADDGLRLDVVLMAAVLDVREGLQRPVSRVGLTEMNYGDAADDRNVEVVSRLELVAGERQGRDLHLLEPIRRPAVAVRDVQVQVGAAVDRDRRRRQRVRTRRASCRRGRDRCE
jgi:hypothetical protein